MSTPLGLRLVGHAATPTETAIVNGLVASVDALNQADASARQLISDWVSAIGDACAAELDQLLETTEGA